jgi:ASC-1-like (ASCH) protein
VVRETDFDYPYERSEDYPSMLEALARDPYRNQLIVDDVAQEMDKGSGGPLLVLTQDEKQDNTLEDMLNERGITSITCDPQTVEEEGQKFSKQLQKKKIQVVLANRQLFQKMLPTLKFEALFFTTPLDFRGKIIERLQKVLRRNNGQPLVRVYDYVDSKISILDNFFRMRSYAYGLRLPRPTTQQ